MFNKLGVPFLWRGRCCIESMTLTLVVIALQVVVMLVALIRESGEDARFEGDKLTFHS